MISHIVKKIFSPWGEDTEVIFQSSNEIKAIMDL